MTLQGSSHQDRSGGIAARDSGLGALTAGLVAAGVLMLSLLAALTVGLEEAHLVTQVPPTATPTRVATRIALPPPSATPTATAPSPTAASPISSSVLLPTPEPTLTSMPSPTCATLRSWSAYRVQTGDSISLLALCYGMTEDALQRGNCLSSPHLTRGQVLYVPKVVATSTPCYHPRDWVRYFVKKGDTLSDLARRVGSTVAALKQTNYRRSDTIYIGEALWVPRLPAEPVHTPIPTKTKPPTRTPSVTPSPTATGPTSTPTPTDSETVEPSSTPEPSATDAVEPTDTPTEAAPSETSVPSDTPPPPDPTDTPRPPEPTDTPRPPDPTNTPRPPDPTDTPRPPDPTQAPAPTDEPAPPGEP